MVAALKPALHLLQLIEDRKYGDAKEFLKHKRDQQDDGLGYLTPDLIYKVAYSFGNEDNYELRSLLMELFRPDFIDQICNDLPKKLEKRLCERLLSEDEELEHAITEATYVLSFFSEFSPKTSYKFDQLIDDVLNKISFDEAAAYPFLIWHARGHPFSPRLLGLTEPIVLIPSVYDQRFLRHRLVEGICEYLTGSVRRSGSAVEPLGIALPFLLKLCEENRETTASHLKQYMELFISLLQFIDDANLEIYQLEIMKMSQDIISCISLEFQALLLKNLIEKIVMVGMLHAKFESQALSWLLDQYEKNLEEKVFARELGSVLGLLENVSYVGSVASSTYYQSLLRIARTFAHSNCVNSSLLAEIRERLVKPIQSQFKKSLRCNFPETTGGEANVLVNRLRELPVFDEDSAKQILSVLQSCEQTLTVINKVLAAFRQTCHCSSLGCFPAPAMAVSPADWEEFRDVLPVKLAENLPTNKNGNLLDAALETAYILFSFKGIPFAIPDSMSEAFTEAMYSLDLDLNNAFPFLVLFSKSHPFSPKLVGITSPTVLIPSVYHRHFLARQLVEGLRIYVEESEYSRDNHYIQPMVTTLDVILNNLREVSSSDIDPCADMILCLLSFIEDFDLHFFRLPIMTKCQDIIHLFPSQLRCLLLKLIVSRLIEDDEVDFDNESNLVAWFIDLYRRFNSAMLSEVETRLVGRIHDQLKDYIRLEEMREKDKKQRKEIEKIPKEVQLQLKLAPEEPVVDQLQLVMFGCEQAKKCIADAIERSK
ncbi:unnamed protein product [Haemonchus placei]|uniref:Fanconi anemia group D2 protein n=1 Tax=Haemonchus placei TaxID=6290 RepID=A0A158QKB4_HAEPC|nr:unnamed protein product [Haemonchus placei]